MSTASLPPDRPNRPTRRRQVQVMPAVPCTCHLPLPPLPRRLRAIEIATEAVAVGSLLSGRRAPAAGRPHRRRPRPAPGSGRAAGPARRDERAPRGRRLVLDCLRARVGPPDVLAEDRGAARDQCDPDDAHALPGVAGAGPGHRPKAPRSDARGGGDHGRVGPKGRASRAAGCAPSGCRRRPGRRSRRRRRGRSGPAGTAARREPRARLSGRPSCGIRIGGRRRSDDGRVGGAEDRSDAGGRRGGPRVADHRRYEGRDRGRARAHRAPRIFATSTPPLTRRMATSNHTPLIARKQDKHFGKRPGTQKHFGKRSGTNGWCLIICRRLTQ
jgi:hypothetical protein